jgi:glycosyltransferase involved in cell wall biosynthesis
MKIVHLIFSFQTGGTETMLVDIVNEQAKQAEVLVVIVNKEISSELLQKIEKSVQIKLLNRIPGSRNLLPLIELNYFLFRIQPDIIHCHNHDAINLLLPLFWSRTVLTLHTIGISVRNLNKFVRLFAISNAVANDVISRIGKHPIVVYNGIYIENIRQKENVIFNNIFRIVQVSRLDHETKGQHLLLNALCSLLKNELNKNIQIDFIGTGNSEKYLKQLAIELGVNDHVNFLGLKDRNYIYQHLCNYNLLVQPSIYEGFGLTVAEGMAANIPVLVSDIEGPLEVIDNGACGFFFQTGNYVDLASQIEYIMQNRELVLQKVKLASERVISEFSVKETALKYLDNYSQL